MMRWLLFAVLAACGSHKDECTEIKDKLRPVLDAMMRDAGKPIPAGEADKLLQDFCRPAQNDEERTFHTCILDASGDAAASACLLPMFDSYRKAMADVGKRSEERWKQERAERDRVARLDAATPDAPPVDAAPPDAAPPIDPASLPEWTVTDRTHGDETAVIAIDAPADTLAFAVWPSSGPLLGLASGKKITGRLVAPSQLGAVQAITALAGIELKPFAARGTAAPVDLAFSGAPQRDLLHLLGDVMHVNIVAAPGALPDVDIRAHRVPADAVLAALAALDQVVPTRAGNVIYLLPKGVKLPPLSKLAGAAITLRAMHASPQQITAALAAVTSFAAHSCATGEVSLALKLVSPAEAARAIGFASGASLADAAPCPIAEATTVDKEATLAVIAEVAAKQVAIVVTAGIASLVRPSPDIAIDGGALTVKGRDVHAAQWIDYGALFSPDPKVWLASLVRTAIVVRIGTAWRAFVETRDGKLAVIDPRHVHQDVPYEFAATPPKISAAGVELVDSRGTATQIPLR